MAADSTTFATAWLNLREKGTTLFTAVSQQQRRARESTNVVAYR